jgi:hypothetical protein
LTTAGVAAGVAAASALTLGALTAFSTFAAGATTEAATTGAVDLVSEELLVTLGILLYTTIVFLF